jgi:hypothetical protein
MFFILFILGFLMVVAGFVMLVQGQFPLGKHQVKSKPARIAGGIWVSYLPSVFAASFLLGQLGLKEVIPPAVIYGILLAICLVAGAIIVLRSAYGGTFRKPRTLAGTAGSRNAFEPVDLAPQVEQGFPAGPDDFFSQSPPPPPASPASKKPGRRAAPQEKNPFDFS